MIYLVRSKNFFDIIFCFIIRLMDVFKGLGIYYFVSNQLVVFLEEVVFL